MAKDDKVKLDPDLVYANSHAIHLVVGPDAQFKTIQAAIDAVPFDNDNRYVISVASGIYREKITVPAGKDFITLEGDWNKKFSTVIVFNGNAGNSGKTFNSSTFAVEADYFVAQYITFKNDANPAAVGAQAVALRVSGNYAAFYDCFITSNQDTLYDDKGKHYYKRTYIQGNIDFIFGQGKALFEDCKIISNSKRRSGSITAQARSLDTDDSGYSFYNSYIGGTGIVDLGRPWKNYAFVVFISNYFDEVVSAAGWDKWNYNPADGTTYFAEYGNYGPGASTLKRVDWLQNLSADDAFSYSDAFEFLDGGKWIFLD